MSHTTVSTKEIHHTTLPYSEQNRDSSSSSSDNSSASTMHAAKDKFMGGIKEAIGTVVSSESLKESGREQIREGDAEAFAAGRGKKHYDPALARKGVGIQHKHLGPNPKKYTEGPCAGCKDGTCTEGHAYDAALCHSVTQGHCDEGRVKDAGLGRNAKYHVCSHRHPANSDLVYREGRTWTSGPGLAGDDWCDDCSSSYRTHKTARLQGGAHEHSKRDKALIKKKSEKERDADMKDRRDVAREKKQDRRDLAYLNKDDAEDVQKHREVV